MFQIDAASPQGNALALLGLARRYAREIGLDPAPLVAEMQTGDYAHLVATFNRAFAGLVRVVGLGPVPHEGDDLGTAP